MSSFTLTASGTKGTITLSSTNGLESSGQAYLAVGAPFTLLVLGQSFGGCTGFFNITSITASWAGPGRFLRQIDQNNPDNNTNVLTTTVFDYSKHDTPFSNYSLSFTSGSQSSTTNFFLGIPNTSYGTSTSIQDTINVTVNYETGQQDTCSFVVNVQIAQMTMNMVWPTTAATKWDLGPVKAYHMVGSTKVYDGIRVAWNDPGYVSGIPSTTDYAFGASAAGGISPMQWSGTGQNTTSSDGVFYFTQLVKCDGYSVGIFHLGRYAFTKILDSSAYSTDNPYGLDTLRNSQGPTPYYWCWDIDVNAPAGSGVVNVPPTNYKNDWNGNPVSYYGDSPAAFYDNVNNDPLDQKWPVIQVHDQSSFQSCFVFNPTGGIPIVMAYYTWGVSANCDNPTAFNSLLWVDAMETPGNWTAGGISSTAPTFYSGPVYITWNYVYDDLKNKTIGTSSWWKWKDQLSANSPNAGPMGGAVAVYGNGGLPGLPRVLAGNVATMNSVM